MAFTQLTTDLNNAQTLPNQPKTIDGWTPAVIKALMDKAPNDIKTYINTVLLTALANATAGTSAAENLGSAPIAGLVGSTIYAQIANLLAVAQAAQAGTILPGVVTDDMLSNIAGQIKDKVNVHLAENAQQITDLQNNKAEKTEVNSLATAKANQADLITQTARIDSLVSTSSGSFYQKSTSGTTGALLVVTSGATSGQINLASVTPVATGYTPVVGDYVLLVYGVASGSAELIDARTGADGYADSNIGTSIRRQINFVEENINALDVLKRINVFDKSNANMLKDKYVNDANGNVIGEDIFTTSMKVGSGYLVTHVIKVKPGDIIRANSNGYNRNILKANANKIITGYETVDLINGYTVPDGVYYVRLLTTYNSTTWDDTLASYMVTINYPMPSVYTPHTKLVSDELQIPKNQIPDLDNGQWYGKVCAAMGTSLTAMGGWTDLVKSYFGFSKLYNRGSGSTTLANLSGYAGLPGSYPTQRDIYTNTAVWGESADSVFASVSGADTTTIDAWYSSDGRINLLPIDADLVLVDIATNDAFNVIQNLDYDVFMTQQALPDVWTAPTLDITKLEGAFYSMIKKIMARCPNARIVVWGMTPNNLLTTNNGYLDKYYAMYDRIIKLCRINGIPFIDTWMYEGANIFNLHTYHTDYVHPATSIVATNGVANAIIGALRNIYPK